MKKYFILFLLILLICVSNINYAQSRKIVVLLNKEVKIYYDDKIQQFQNVRGTKVYPITYGGTTYLPLRSISSLFNEKIKWDGTTNSIYLGEGEVDKSSSKENNTFVKGKNENIEVLLNEDIKIYYNGKIQVFRDVNNGRVYPLSYEGVTYLPVRATSNLFGAKIDWSVAQNAVLISRKTNSTSNTNSTGNTNSTSKTVAVVGVILSNKTLSLKIGESGTLVAKVTPADATNKNVTWTSSNAGVASVSNGKVTAVKEGTAIVTASTLDGAKKASCLVTVTSSAPKTIAVVGVILNRQTLPLKVGEHSTLVATVIPNDATNKNVAWSSSNSGVASVSNGTVTAVKEGTAIVTVSTADGTRKASCLVTVTSSAPKTIAVAGVTLNRQTLPLKVGEHSTLVATVTPNNATNKNVTWSSSNADIVSVSNGTVTAIKEGTAIVTVSTVDGAKKASCLVTVTNPVPKTIAVTGVSLNKQTLSLKVGESNTLVATVAPNDATNKNVTWSSSNADIVSVSNGTVTAIKEGTAIVSVSTADGNKKTGCVVTVTRSTPKTIAVTGISLNKQTLSLKVGERSTLVATVTPNDATNKRVTWTSSNTNVARVLNGAVTAMQEGTAIVTVSTVDGAKKASCKITVTKPTARTVAVTKVSLNKQAISLKVGESSTLVATVSPSNATNKNVTWTSSNTSVATISNGKVTALKAGTTTITVKTVDGSKTARCTINVIQKVNNIRFQNPIRVGNKVLYGADPWVIQSGGYYYFTCTRGNAIEISKTKKLQDIGQNFKKVYTSPKNATIWAPELHYINGKWYIYYTDLEKNEEGKYGTNRRLYVLRAKTSDPFGEYQYVGKVYDKKHDFYAIDGTVLQWNNELYLLWSGWDSKTWHDWMYHRIYIAKLNKEKPWIIEGDRVAIAKSEKSWEKNGGYVLEAPQVLIKNGVLHIIYSASGAKSDKYCLGMLTYKGGNLLRASSWEKASKPVFESGNGVYSPGHCSFTKSPDGKEDWIVYHAAYKKGDSSKGLTNIRMQKFTWNGTTPVFGKPVANDSYSNAPSQ